MQTSGMMTPEREPNGGRSASAQGSAPALLAIDGITIRFGGVVALDKVRFEVAGGQICGLIGPNGAGKTSLFNCISRLYDPHSGSIRFDGRALERVPKPRDRGARHRAHVSKSCPVRVDDVRQNVMVGSHAIARGGFLANALATPLARREEKKIAERADALIEEFGLAEVAERLVSELPFGTKKRVELARALAIEPKLLLLDEPAAGLNHEEVDALGAEIRAIRDRRGVSVLLVEHHMNLVMRISDQVVALDFGRLIANGTPDEVRANPEVIRAYLGSAA